MTKLRDFAEILFTNALFIAFAMLIFAPSYAAEPRHFLGKSGVEAVVLFPTPCVGPVAKMVKPEFAGKVFRAAYVWSDGRAVMGCYAEVDGQVQVMFEDGDSGVLDGSLFKPGLPRFGTAI